MSNFVPRDKCVAHVAAMRTCLESAFPVKPDTWSAIKDACDGERNEEMNKLSQHMTKALVAWDKVISADMGVLAADKFDVDGPYGAMVFHARLTSARANFHKLTWTASDERVEGERGAAGAGDNTVPTPAKDTVVSNRKIHVKMGWRVRDKGLKLCELLETKLEASQTTPMDLDDIRRLAAMLASRGDSNNGNEDSDGRVRCATQ